MFFHERKIFAAGLKISGLVRVRSGVIPAPGPATARILAGLVRVVRVVRAFWTNSLCDFHEGLFTSSRRVATGGFYYLNYKLPQTTRTTQTRPIKTGLVAGPGCFYESDHPDQRARCVAPLVGTHTLALLTRPCARGAPA